MTDTRAKPRSNTIFTLSHNWKDEVGESHDTSIEFTDATETGSEYEDNSNLTIELSTTSQNGTCSPWRYEMTRGSRSSSDLASSTDSRPSTPKTSNKIRPSSIKSLPCKKTFLSKNSSIKTPSSRKKSWNTPRSKVAATTGKKNYSKYSWKGTFGDERLRRAILPTKNTSAYLDIGNGKFPFDSTTRSSSPVDENFFYSVDSDIEARVFRLNKSRSAGPRCCQNNYKNSCDDNDPRRCGEHSIEDPDVGECSNVQNHEAIYSYNSEYEFYDRKSEPTSDYYSCSNNDLTKLTLQEFPDERWSSRFVPDFINVPRASVTSDSSSTLVASGGSGRSKSLRKSNFSRISLEDTILTAKIIDNRDGEFEIQNENLEIESNDNQKVSTSKFRSVLRCVGNIFIALLKNIVLLSILPTVYIAFFICIQNREDRDSF